MSIGISSQMDIPLQPDAGFTAIANLARAEAGLALPLAKATMVQSRLRTRLSALNMPDFESYSRFVCSAAGVAERRHMISALTTNVSHFFRETHHFDIAREQVFPQLISRARAGGRVRIWSAGCSSGQEPYSIAMSLLEQAPDLAKRDVLILGSDIDPRILALAEAAEYSAAQIAGIPDPLRDRFLIKGTAGKHKMSPEITNLVRFRELNLIRDWPMKGQFDAIFCRNVVIYFDAETREGLWPRFHRALTPGGWLFLGHSERISDSADSLFTSTGLTTYRPAGASAPEFAESGPQKKE